MSIFDHCSIISEKPLETASIGRRLANCLYGSTVLALQGELGAGKTTFIQGLARGLGIDDNVVSPTYALENHYKNLLTHIDLYRLDEEEAERFLATNEWKSAVNVIEWPERAPKFMAGLSGKILVQIHDTGLHSRSIDIEFADAPIPSSAQIKKWLTATKTPEHIVQHMHTVAKVADVCCDDFERRGVPVRRKALHAAALVHDILRFVDFASLDGDDFYKPSSSEKSTWTALKHQYDGLRHEWAAQAFLQQENYEVIGDIVSTHGANLAKDPSKHPSTLEQQLLAYADKRVCFTKIVSIDERFDDFLERYSNGSESDFSKGWRSEMKILEERLFPDGPPL